MSVTRARIGRLIAPCCCLLGLGAFAACQGEPGGERSLTPAELRERIQELYESARDAGEDVPSDAYAWAKSDIERIGDWEYRIERLEAEPDEVLAERLAELGAERWEIFWLERQGAELRVFLKRPARSYLRMLPVSELGRLVPLGGSATAD